MLCCGPVDNATAAPDADMQVLQRASQASSPMAELVLGSWDDDEVASSPLRVASSSQMAVSRAAEEDGPIAQPISDYYYYSTESREEPQPVQMGPARTESNFSIMRRVSSLRSGADTESREEPQPVQMGCARTDFSIMQRVSRRMESLDEQRFAQDVPISPQCTAISSKMKLGIPKPEDRQRSRVSLRTVVASAFAVTTLVPCMAMLILIEVLAAELRSCLDSEAGGILTTARLISVAVCVFMTGASLMIGCVIGGFASLPMQNINRLMQQFGELGIQQEDPSELGMLLAGANSRISDIASLQATFCRLWRSTETFARYVPEPVVRGIVCGNSKSSRLHVTQREVSIMCSDIRDFTTISEFLSQEDLLFVLTRYLSIMTQIVEYYEGVVAEILGDGLLVFWNAPDDVRDHAAKACSAALAQQQALQPLNAELARLSLPQLAIRIGLHTGNVLCGNIGSDVKMKWGCMGDPVNLASRLEGLCKMYGVGVLCSSATRKVLQKESGFVFRQLDLVQVNGKTKPTRIYEVIGFSSQYESEEYNQTAAAQSIRSAFGRSPKALQKLETLFKNPLKEGNLSTRFSRTISSDYEKVDLYEQALKAYQKAYFGQACERLETFMQQWPDDIPAQQLLERARRYVGGSIGADGEAGGSLLSSEELASWTGVEVLRDK